MSPIGNRHPQSEKHGPGCTCNLCLAAYQQREQAAQRLYRLFDLYYGGLTEAQSTLPLIRESPPILDWLDKKHRARVERILRDMPDEVERLMAQALDQLD